MICKELSLHESLKDINNKLPIKGTNSSAWLMVSLYRQQSKTSIFHILGLITHWRTAPSHRRTDGVKLVGCDICDAFNIVNGFRDEAAVESHTKHVHGEVSYVDAIMSQY